MPEGEAAADPAHQEMVEGDADGHQQQGAQRAQAAGAQGVACRPADALVWSLPVAIINLIADSPARRLIRQPVRALSPFGQSVELKPLDVEDAQAAHRHGPGQPSKLAQRALAGARRLPALPRPLQHALDVGGPELPPRLGAACELQVLQKRWSGPVGWPVAAASRQGTG